MGLQMEVICQSFNELVIQLTNQFNQSTDKKGAILVHAYTEKIQEKKRENSNNALHPSIAQYLVITIQRLA